MRSTITLTAFAFLLSFTTASADDLQTLLRDLSFSQPPAHGLKATRLGVATMGVGEQLKPAPLHQAQQGFTLPDDQAPSYVTLKAPVAHSDQSLQVPNHFDANLAQQELAEASDSVSANSVGFMKIHAACNSGCDGACDGGCDSYEPVRKRLRKPACESCVVLPPDGCDCGCGGHQSCLSKRHHEEEPKVCMPRREVNLPQSSLREYFRSNRCYTNVWDGYSQECGSHHKHIHGTCDCHIKKDRKSCLGGGGCGEILPAQPCGQAGCDDQANCGCGCGR
ncbi:hypothetical protein N9N28_06165 [Rubripirellula amarantea]|uniref:Uncharacterized protein n=1 Tax=Rubripirellula amarantea TaxID=2527999 RepID=A0A5C5WSZ5_9BACT|nr:hypothetical protein [Rubripirellula amarantea]MDA8744201.1 hypothetical protein [Rubripirellula amarantea]TWT53275.1 hypothetical protein Pla22_09030 [Rubripirellula amarantea]